MGTAEGARIASSRKRWRRCRDSGSGDGAARASSATNVDLLLGIKLESVALAVYPAINDPTFPAIVHLVFDLHSTRNLTTASEKPSGINDTF